MCALKVYLEKLKMEAKGDMELCIHFLLLVFIYLTKLVVFGSTG